LKRKLEVEREVEKKERGKWKQEPTNNHAIKEQQQLEEICIKGEEERKQKEEWY